MQETPPPGAQVLPDTAETIPVGPGPVAGPPAIGLAPEPAVGPKPTYLRPADPIQAGPQPVAPAQAAAETADPNPASIADPGDAGATVIPRRPVIEGGGRSRADVPWLGIGSWLLLCGALFASLLGWPDQSVLDRVTSIWSSVSPSSTVARMPAPGGAIPTPGEPSAVQGVPSPLPTGEQEALPPTELAPPIRAETPADTDEPAGDGPPLPRFKPSVDRLAAEFSNAFFEIGERLRQQGDFDAAVHMRRQGTNLDPWKTSSASAL